MTDTHNSSPRWSAYSALLIFVGSLMLVLNLVSVRALRIARADVPFFSPEFAVLSLSALLLIVISWWLLLSGRLMHWLSGRLLLALGWLVISFSGLAGLTLLAEAFANYAAPFALWLIFINATVLLIALAPHLARFNWAVILRQATFILLGILAPLLMLEVGMRLWFGVFGTEADRIAYLYTNREIVENASRFGGRPYVNFELSDNFSEHNSRGYRGPAIVNPKPEGTYRIVTLGGSTTYGISLAPDETYPAQLQQILHDDYGYTNVEVINGGVIAYSTFDTLAHFAYRVLDDDPDLIIIYHAVNDVVARLVDPAAYGGLNPVRGIWSPESRPLSPSALVRFVGINAGLIDDPSKLTWILHDVSDVVRCEERDFCPGLGMTPQEVLDANPPIYFERNLRNILSLAATNDVDVMLSSWAYFPDESNYGQVMTQQHMQNGVAQHNAITARLANEWNLPFYDLYEQMPYDPDFWLDGLHMTASGSREQAEEYAAFMVENSIIPAPDLTTDSE